MKIQVHANLQFGRGRTFMKGIYEGEIPKELIAEMKSGSKHISEIDVPNVKQGRVKPTAKELAAKKAAAAEKRKIVAARKKKEKAAADKVAADKVAAEKLQK